MSTEGAFADAPGDAEGRQFSLYAGETSKALRGFGQLGKQHVNGKVIADRVHISSRRSQLYASDKGVVDFHSLPELSQLEKGVERLCPQKF